MSPHVLEIDFVLCQVRQPPKNKYHQATNHLLETCNGLAGRRILTTVFRHCLSLFVSSPRPYGLLVHERLEPISQCLCLTISKVRSPQAPEYLFKFLPRAYSHVSRPHVLVPRAVSASRGIQVVNHLKTMARANGLWTCGARTRGREVRCPSTAGQGETRQRVSPRGMHHLRNVVAWPGVGP